MAKKKQQQPEFDKYYYYSKAVQDASFDIDFLNEKYQELRGRKPLSFREDFCGAAHLGTEWVKQSSKHTAVGVDLDPETIQYGKEHYWSQLKPDQQKRFEYHQQDVTKTKDSADIICAFNFSYWIFRERKQLLKYFKAVRKNMKNDSVFFLDTSGGTEVVDERSECKELDGFKYYWECESFNPINHECHFAIHVKPDGRKIQKHLFTYHWRYWTLPEIRDVLAEAGFSKTLVYMEGDDGEGEGDGEFDIAESAEECMIWVAYIAALP